MYTILVTHDNALIVTHKEAIMQRSKLVNTLQILVSPIYDDLDLSSEEYSVVMEYCLPISHKYGYINLQPEQELYKDMIQYLVPIDTKFTAEAGEVSIQLTWHKVSFEDDVNTKQQVRKTSEGFIKINPISAWSDIIPDEALTSLDQKIIAINNGIKAIEEFQDNMVKNQVDGLYIDPETFELQLMIDEEPIGNKIPIVVPRLPDTEDGSHDGIIELGDYELNGDNEDDKPCCDCCNGIIEL